MNLREATTRGVLWSGLSTWGEQTISLVVILVLARLLEPKDFGVVAFASVFAYMFQWLISFTFNQTLVQRKELTNEHLDSAFWMALVLAICVAATLVTLAAPLSLWLDQPTLAAVLPWLSMSGLFHALHVVQGSYMMRHLRFKPIAVRTLTAVSAGGATGVVMAYHGFGYWSIVAQLLVQSSASAALMWAMCPWRPRFRFSGRHSREILVFGKFVSGTGLVAFVNERGDAFVIGYILGPAALGIYNVGRRLLRMLTDASTGTLVRVIFSSFSRLQDRPQQLRLALTETLRFSSLIMLPLLIGLSVVAEEAVHVLLGEKWLGAVDIVRYLALAGVAQYVSFLNISVVVACGKPHWHLYVSIAYAFLNLMAIIAAVPYGIVAVATALAAVIIVREPFTILLVQRVAPMRISDYGRALGPGAVGSLVMVSAVLATREVWGDVLTPFAALWTYVAVGAIFYVVSVCIIAPASVRQAAELLRKVMFQRASAAG